MRNLLFKTIFAVWAALVIFSVIFAALIPDKRLVQYVAFFFLLITETATAASLASLSFAKARANFNLLALGVSVTASVYFIVAGLLAVLALAGVLNNPPALAFLELALLLLLGVAVWVFFLFAQKREGADAEISRKAARSLSWEKRLAALRRESPQGSPVQLGLEKVLEEVRYFSKTAELPSDLSFAAKLLELEKLLAPSPAADALPGAEGPVAPDSLPGASDSPAPESQATESAILGVIEELRRLALARRDESALARRGRF
ncbi:MAG: hypothetical protein LBO66_08550 [Deltaproteobacteria bacterium]|jgi:hypothetical protein|nr:hypothetical protein [Deltaproteobacteria bacterium]